MRRTHVGNIAPHYTGLVFLGDVNGPFPRVQIRCPISQLTNAGPGHSTVVKFVPREGWYKSP
jgi:hypothetical protein